MTYQVIRTEQEDRVGIITLNRPEAMNALARQAVDVRSMISRVFSIDKAIDAFAAAADPENVKVLLKINPR